MSHEPTELLWIGCLIESMWIPKFNSNTLTPNHQLADILTKGNFARDEWNNLLHLFNISHSLFRLKITVGCLTSTYPSILSPRWNLKITVGCPSCAYPRIRTKTCRHVGLRGPRGKHASCGHVHPCWRACAGVPLPRMFEFTSLWHSQGTAEKSPCVNTFWDHHEKKKKETFLSLFGSLGRRHRTKTHGR